MKNIPPRRLFIFGLLLILPMMLVLAFGEQTREEEPWPILAKKTAEEISLSQAWDLLNDPSEGRRAAIVGTELVIEIPAEEADKLTGLFEAGAIAGQAAADKDTGTPGGDRPKVPGLNDSGTYIHLTAEMPYPPSRMISSIVQDAAVDVRIYEPINLQPTWTDRIISIVPAILIIGLLIFFLTRGATKSLGLSSSFEVIETENLTQSFEDVAGIDAARSEIQEIVDFLKNPEEASRLGGRMPKGALFDGPPGSGKTLLARAMAKEAGVPFLTIEASGVNQLFVGAGAMKIKRAFREARKRAPCIVFIDEIDAMGKARGSSNSGAGDEKETTLNALLVELDGFDAREGVFLIAATNRPEVLDPALTRRGRIDRKITVDLPDLQARREILQVHCRSIKGAVGLDTDSIARSTFGFSGADLAALVNEAALMATRNNRDWVDLESFEKARDRLLVGLSGNQRKLNEADRNLTAYHEAGHALIAALCPHADPIEKATILPQGRAGGYVMQSPDADHSYETRDRLISRIRVAVAGREAERLVFGEGAVTSGAASDIQQATRVAQTMVLKLGMSKQGFLAIDPANGALVDPQNPPVREIRDIISSCQESVRSELEENETSLRAVAEALKSRETLSGEDIRKIVLG